MRSLKIKCPPKPQKRHRPRHKDAPLEGRRSRPVLASGARRKDRAKSRAKRARQGRAGNAFWCVIVR